jgi:hypothetical protein
LQVTPAQTLTHRVKGVSSIKEFGSLIAITEYDTSLTLQLPITDSLTSSVYVSVNIITIVNTRMITIDSSSKQQRH